VCSDLFGIKLCRVIFFGQFFGQFLALDGEKIIMNQKLATGQHAHESGRQIGRSMWPSWSMGRLPWRCHNFNLTPQNKFITDDWHSEGGQKWEISSSAHGRQHQTVAIASLPAGVRALWQSEEAEIRRPVESRSQRAASGAHYVIRELCQPTCRQHAAALELAFWKNIAKILEKILEKDWKKYSRRIEQEFSGGKCAEDEL